MITVRLAEDRGRADFGWLDSRHTFSFGSYYDPEHMGFSALRVINDDKVAPGAGFDTHGHKDMEIISLVTEGEIEHKDSMGNVQRLPAGEFQLMSAGKGVFHSEYNASKEKPLRFLQIWIVPEQTGGKPGYQQKDFGRAPGLTPIVTPDGANGTLQVKQQASLFQLLLPPEGHHDMRLNPARRYYVHMVTGQLRAGEHTLQAGDGAAIEQHDSLSFVQQGGEQAMALIFELP
ncbi:pirin family protein [Aestuariibacter halophilus]|uniref:Pirin family protein n=1 Tax=Fluctibacter halophilus TaxID=226011 RepID=A0ABS8G9B6_9ALTE|nr:pirin family protein [Aestuariibacter halophilus]MCC2617140.1 pirin family protein [Aestuariibacter halophilus]